MNKKKQALSKGSGIIILLLYLLALIPKVHHHHEHQHEHAHDSQELSFQEHLEHSSDCHNATYHGMVEDCGHDHLSEAEEECLSCQILAKTKSSSDWTNLEEGKFIAEKPIYKIENKQLVLRKYTLPSLRGPPVL